jgi:hypothetical protein
MNKLNRCTLFASMACMLGILLCSSGNSQSPTPYTPKIIPPSPNAASLGKFGDIPVSPYTGSTDISIPIYTIQAKGVTVPITLSYHSGGIRLSEEAGWVGLGWALSAGGMVSRTINDKDDFTAPYFNANMGGFAAPPEVKGRLTIHPYYHETEVFPATGGASGVFSYVPKNLPVYGYDFGCNYWVNTDHGNYNFYSAIGTGNADVYDMEADSYSFNFLGESGKFIIGRDGTVVLQKQENIKIQFAADGSSFTITDENGNKFYFNDKEYNQPATGGAQTISSWLLSKIITQQKDSVLFNYSTDNTWTTTVGISHETYRRGCSGSETAIFSNDPGQKYLNRVLQSIDYSNAQVQFSFDGRTDVTDAKKLNTIKVYSKDQSGLTYIKEHQLYYSYFTPSGVSTTEFSRLRLDSVREVSGYLSLPPYKFDYNMPSSQTLMGKHYSSVDHWGYYSGKSNAINGDNTLGFTGPFTGVVAIGSTHQGGLNSIYLDLSGANRDPDSACMKAFSLKQVKYPTGGSTYIDYDPNYYDYARSTAVGVPGAGKDMEYIATSPKVIQYTISTYGTTNGTIDFSTIYQTSSTLPNATVSISFRAAINDSLNKYHNNTPYGKINFTFQGNTTDITTSSLNCNGTVCATSNNLTISSASAYSWSAYIDPSISIPNGFIEITVTFTFKESGITNRMMAGGLRVKSVTDVDANGRMLRKKRYEYDYLQDRNGDGIDETYSYGRQMGYVSYARFEPIMYNYPDGFGETHAELCQSLSRYGSSCSGFTSQSSGNIVGYDKVIEYQVDSLGKDNGYIVYSFYNSSDTAFSYGGTRVPGASALASNLNGLLQSKIVYKKVGLNAQKVSEEESFYTTANRIIYNNQKILSYTDAGGHAINSNTSCPNNLDSLNTPTIACFYPAIHSERILMDSVKQYMYDQSGNGNVVVSKTYSYYDNPLHYQLTRSKTVDSKGNAIVSMIKYPQDYIPGGYSITSNTILDSMINKNMVGETIEKRDSFYYSGSSTGYIKGAQLSVYKLLSSQSIALDKQYNLEISSPVTDFQPFAISGNSTSQDSRYRQMISFDTYDNTGNILQYTMTDQLPMSIVWDYKNLYPTAQIKKSGLGHVAYSSFEADGTGNWSYTGTSTVDATSPTGSNCYNLGQSSGNITKSGLSSSTEYLVSYWRKTSSPLSITGTQSGYPIQGKTIDGWTYFEHKVTGQTTITVSGSNYIDELRLYPFNAQMTTYTYTPLVGMTSACDVGNRITYYFYDPLSRLKWIKDQDKNIIKTVKYHYIGQGN